ncbi:MAG TPA: transglutaminase domain-containing protein, partial [Chitinophagaceae bacterium]
MKLHLSLAIFLLWGLIQANAQDKSSAKFGKIVPEDFAPKVYSVDSNANAVIIADIGSSKIVGNNKGWFSLEFKHYCRARLLNKNGFDLATDKILLYSVGDKEEKLLDFKAATYNLENGKVVSTPLDKENIFKEKLTKNLEVRKFTFPNIKEGSIIEFEYTVNSDYLHYLRAWSFQGDYPRLWSEYNVTIPAFFNYMVLSQGYEKFFIQDKKTFTDNFNVVQSNGVEASNFITISNANVGSYRWVVKDIPALRGESFVSTIDNHIQKIDFVLVSQTEPLQPFSYMSSWPQKTEDLMNDEDFGLSLSKDNGWLGDVVKPAMIGATSMLEKAKRIYAFARDNLTCTDYSDIWLGQSLKNVLKTKNGSVADINLLLVAMLRYAGIPADPVLLSTRDNGYTYPPSPILSRFNYVICCATINGKQIL